MTARGFLCVADAAATVEPDEARWLIGVRDALRAAFPGALAAEATTYELGTGRAEVTARFPDGELARTVTEEWRVALATTDGSSERSADPGIVTATASLGGELPAALASRWRARGVEDVVELRCTLPGGGGLSLYVAVGAPVSRTTLRQAAALRDSIEGHFALRRALPSRGVEDAVDAIFSSRGPGPRPTVRVRSVGLSTLEEAARNGSRPRAEPAVASGGLEAVGAIWVQLCAGRYRLVDQVDRDGRRYVVLLEAPEPDPLRALTPVEAKIASLCGRAWSNRQIAFELHCSESAVENHLSRALGKLRLPVRADLVRLYTQLHRAAGASAPGPRHTASGARRIDATATTGSVASKVAVNQR